MSYILTSRPILENKGGITKKGQESLVKGHNFGFYFSFFQI